MDHTLSVPSVDQRKRIPMKVIHALAERIAERFRPQRIILFGSYAYGHPLPESDVDLLVIMETVLKETEQAYLIRQSLDVRFGLDLLVYKPDTLKQRIDWGDSFLREITTQGRVLYESANP
jgi:predicted nucleotidyltransferase